MTSPLGKPLSPREAQVARLVLTGLKYAEIGKRLNVGTKTVAVWMHHARSKAGASNNAMFALSSVGQSLTTPTKS